MLDCRGQRRSKRLDRTKKPKQEDCTMSLGFREVISGLDLSVGTISTETASCVDSGVGRTPLKDHRLLKFLIFCHPRNHCLVLLMKTKQITCIGHKMGNRVLKNLNFMMILSPSVSVVLVIYPFISVYTHTFSHDSKIVISEKS
jgi:hypothetical protein